ncbi:unnamed protein product [Allacma fusca]|uniref:SEC7 domain-containing protein n=1 Tax=Allacma fusca TaxID=39272 RepID=A0A8J2LH02_9HEXA|nr:unnamed protein product [Allacma fusca]
MSPRIQTSRQAVYVVKGEVCVIIASLRKTARWNSHQQDSKQDAILRKLQSLKESLDADTKTSMVKISADANYFLTPFLDVIRSEDTSGRVTVRALSSIEKFISYEIVNEANGSSGAVEAITDAVIHAHFVSTDSASDELVLMKILQVLHHLFVSPLGTLLSNESVCELMQSCFRMCFIERANELLRNSAEAALTEMICLLFSRLHSFPAVEATKKNKVSASVDISTPLPHCTEVTTFPAVDAEEELKKEEPAVFSTPESVIPASTDMEIADTSLISKISGSVSLPEIQVQEPTPQAKVPEASVDEAPKVPRGTFTTKRGVTFTVDSLDGDLEDSSSLASPINPVNNGNNSTRARITVPYGIPCVRELFRFLISLINPNEKQNSDLMIHVGLKLLLVTIETGVDSMSKHTSLMSLVKNELSKNLFSLLNYQPPPNSLLTASSVLLNVLRIFLLIFDTMRHLLKFQLEVFFVRVGEMITDGNATLVGQSGNTGNSNKWNYEQREIALDFLVQLWKLPCFVTELYLNYDCDLYCSNIFEDTTKLLSKNAFTLQAGVNSIHLLCLEGLVSILDGIESHCTHRILHSNPALNSSSFTSDDSNCSSVFYHEADAYQVTTPTSTESLLLSGRTPSDYHPGSELDHTENVSLVSVSFSETVGSFGFSSQPRKGLVNTAGNRTPEERQLPSHEELMAIRHKKKILHTGSEHFNTQASKGIEFLQTQGLLSSPLDPHEVAHFLRENPLLDKRAIGDYIASKKYPEIRGAFVTSFDFSKTRVDEALRVFLETFRLPGEAPLISNIMEEFAAHWGISNGNPFADVDAAYRLGYATIMLNVDQHNTNVKKQGNSMTFDDFKKNLRGLNGGEDFDPQMLQDIYAAIKNDEIIMPAEQVGLVKENYLWKVLLRRGTSSACKFLRPANDEGVFDHDLFSLAWGPIVAALSFIFDKTTEQAIITKCLAAFRKCATISAHYSMSDVFDNLVISLCKFTTLLSGNVDLGVNKKAQAACRAVFQHVHRHGDILREGWRNFIDCLVALFKLQILPKILTESEDFTEPSGRVSLVRRTVTSTPRVETGLFSSIYSYIALSAADSPANKSSVADEEETRKRSLSLMVECRPELLLSESKFLQLDSLQELIKSLVYASPAPESKRKDYDEDAVVFVLEILLKIAVQNRDRALAFWDVIREHLFGMILAAASSDMSYLLERSVVGLMRVALRLMRKEDLCPIILQSLRILLYLRPAAVIQLSQQMSFGLHEILKTTAANIHTAEEWTIIFTLLEYVGAGKVPSSLISSASVSQTQGVSLEISGSKSVDAQTHPLLQHSLSQDPIPQGGIVGSSSGSDRGYTSDSELEIRGSSDARVSHVSPAQSWILLTQDDQQQVGIQPQSPVRGPLPQSQIVQPERQLFYPDPNAIRSFVEASTLKARSSRNEAVLQGKKKRGKKSHNIDKEGNLAMTKSKSFPGPGATNYDADESDNEDQIAASHQVSVQLLDLLHTLHLRAAQIFQWWQKENTDVIRSSSDASIWTLGWKPILQAMVILCSDSRKPVRTTALNYLQNALLVHDLQQLSASEWHSCFRDVLFPLMGKLLEALNPLDPVGMEETRMRAVTLLGRVFLQHLTPLSQLESFSDLWLQILEFLKNYLQHPERSELLSEGIPENVKNLLLVMQTGGVFHTPDGYTRLWVVTWEKIDSFIPTLRAELFRSVSVGQTRMIQQPETAQEEPQLHQTSVIYSSPVDSLVQSSSELPPVQPSSPVKSVADSSSATLTASSPLNTVPPVSTVGNFTIQIDDIE